jgi:hypothetical protein
MDYAGWHTRGMAVQNEVRVPAFLSPVHLIACRGSPLIPARTGGRAASAQRVRYSISPCHTSRTGGRCPHKRPHRGRTGTAVLAPCPAGWGQKRGCSVVLSRSFPSSECTPQEGDDGSVLAGDVRASAAVRHRRQLRRVAWRGANRQ